MKLKTNKIKEKQKLKRNMLEVEIYPNKRQIERIKINSVAYAVVSEHLMDEGREIWEEDKNFISQTELSKELTRIRNDNKKLLLASRAILNDLVSSINNLFYLFKTNTENDKFCEIPKIENLNKTYQFKRGLGFVCKRSKMGSKSFILENDGILTLAKIGKIKTNLKSKLVDLSEVKSLSVFTNEDKYYSVLTFTSNSNIRSDYHA